VFVERYAPEGVIEQHLKQPLKSKYLEFHVTGIRKIITPPVISITVGTIVSS
jgi:hypothetical protein